MHESYNIEQNRPESKEYMLHDSVCNSIKLDKTNLCCWKSASPGRSGNGVTRRRGVPGTAHLPFSGVDTYMFT